MIMRTFALILATFSAFASIVAIPSKSLAQSPYGAEENTDRHRVLTVRRQRTVDRDCGAPDDCWPYRSDPYDVGADAGDPFSTCTSGCDIDVIFRALTGRPNEGWKR